LKHADLLWESSWLLETALGRSETHLLLLGVLKASLRWVTALSCETTLGWEAALTWKTTLSRETSLNWEAVLRWEASLSWKTTFWVGVRIATWNVLGSIVLDLYCGGGLTIDNSDL